MKCITCGSEEIMPYPRYLILPGVITFASSYFLCREHEKLRYEYDDAYDENGIRKKINHEVVIERCKEKENL